MKEQTESYRRQKAMQLSRDATNREGLEARYGQVWDTVQLHTDFVVVGFLSPYCVVRNRRTQKKGSLEFQHAPRFYFKFVENDGNEDLHQVPR